MKHLSPLNEKARRLERAVDGAAADAEKAQPPPASPDADDVALQMMTVAHIPLGCSTVFSPGWEVDRTGGTAGLCQPVERDLFDCHFGCFWPVQVPDQLNHAPDWTKKCAAAQKDWRKIDVIFP
jgi:hypothetical protein